MRPKIKHHDLELFITANLFEGGRNYGPNLLGRCLRLLDFARDVRIEIAYELLEYGEKQFFLVSELIVYNTFAHAGRVGDILHGDIAISLEGDTKESRLNYFGSSFWCYAHLG